MDFFKNFNGKEISENCFQIINIGIIQSLTQESNSNKVYFYAQSRKGDFFVCCIERLNTFSDEEIINIEFLYEIESNVESFCKLVFCEYKNLKNYAEKKNFAYKDEEVILVFLASSKKENILNVFSLELTRINAKQIGDNSQKEFNDNFKPAILENTEFYLVHNSKMHNYFFNGLYLI